MEDIIIGMVERIEDDIIDRFYIIDDGSEIYGVDNVLSGQKIIAYFYYNNNKIEYKISKNGIPFSREIEMIMKEIKK